MSKSIGRGLGPGPVFVYEWITSTRRWQGYALRSLFVLGLLAAALVIGISQEDAGLVVGPARAPRPGARSARSCSWP